MAAISRSTLYSFERLATARDRMPNATATGGRVYSSFISAVPKAATWWWTNERGDLRLFRSNAINVLQTLQEEAGAEKDRYWGSQTRTRLMQYTGLSDAPSAPVPMRELLEAAIARALEAKGFGPGTVVIPQLASFPPLDAPRGTFVGGVGTAGDNLLYWDGSRGVFRASEAPPVADVPPTPVDPTLIPVDPTLIPVETPPVVEVPRAMGRIAMVIRVVNAPPDTLTFDDMTVPLPFRVADQKKLTDHELVVIDGPDGLAAPLVFFFRVSDGTRLMSNPVPFTWRSAAQQNVDMEFDASTSRLTVIRNVSVVPGEKASDGNDLPPIVQSPLSIQQAGILGGSPVIAVAVVAVLMGSLYLWDRSRPRSQRIFRPL